MFVQSSEQLFRRGRGGDCLVEDDVRCADLFPIEILVGAVVRAEGRAGQRHTGKKAAGAGVGEDLGAQGGIGFGGSVATYGTGGRGGVAADFDLAGEPVR